ncbi:MAG: preprotein translocase subunit SecE [Anaerolineae bacterium]
MTESGKRTGSVKKASPEKKPGKQQNPISRYFRETRGELRKVTWPSREESWRLTLIVLGVTVAMAAFLWVFDTLFSNSIQFLLQQLI